MEFNVIKAANVEYCENIYALSINYLKKSKNNELSSLLDNLIDVENRIRKCNDVNTLNLNTIELNKIIEKIEGIINE